MAKITIKFSLDKIKEQARTEMAKELTTTFLKNEIVNNNIARGVSPVKSQRFKKYSASYKEQIRGNAFLGEDGEFFIFRRINGRTVKINVDKKKLDNNPLQDKAGGKKSVSPVNLKLTGELHDSFFSKTLLDRPGVRMGFSSKLASIHNDEGAGKSKVKRRMLPTISGETFNASITRAFKNKIEIAIRRVIARQNR